MGWPWECGLGLEWSGLVNITGFICVAVCLLYTTMSELVEGRKQEDGDSRPVTVVETANKQVEKK